MRLRNFGSEPSARYPGCQTVFFLLFAVKIERRSASSKSVLMEGRFVTAVTRGFYSRSSRSRLRRSIFTANNRKKKPLAPRVSARSTSRPYVRPPLHVSGCEMAHLNTWYWTSMLWSIDICPKSICWPVSHDCIACLGIQLMEVMLFLKFSADQLFVFNWSWAEVNFFKGRIQFAPCLRPKYN